MSDRRGDSWARRGLCPRCPGPPARWHWARCRNAGRCSTYNHKENEFDKNTPCSSRPNEPIFLSLIINELPNLPVNKDRFVALLKKIYIIIPHSLWQLPPTPTTSYPTYHTMMPIPQQNQQRNPNNVDNYQVQQQLQAQQDLHQRRLIQQKHEHVSSLSCRRKLEPFESRLSHSPSPQQSAVRYLARSLPLSSLSWRRKLEPWESRLSRSISPNRTPPPFRRPFTGWWVRMSIGPIDRTWYLSLTWTQWFVQEQVTINVSHSTSSQSL